MEDKLRQMQEEMKRMQDQLAVAKNASPAPNRSLQEIDVFQTTSRSATNAPLSPVKTNPFAAQDKPKKLAKFHPETPHFGPKLAEKTTRILTGEEKRKFQQQLQKTDVEKKMAAIVANDLADSSDEESVRLKKNRLFLGGGGGVKNMVGLLLLAYFGIFWNIFWNILAYV
jgi:hypothetical protein